MVHVRELGWALPLVRMVSCFDGGEPSQRGWREPNDWPELETQIKGWVVRAVEGGSHMEPWLVVVRQWFLVDLGKKATESAWGLEVEPTTNRPKNNDLDQSTHQLDQDSQVCTVAITRPTLTRSNSWNKIGEH